MLISPPFLPVRTNPQLDETWLATAMAGGDQMGNGFFPLGPFNSWHGGMHMQAPTTSDGNGQLPVCAIADGTVAYRRTPTPPSKTHPLNYHGSSDDLQWTDNGVVVLRHELELGANDLAKVVVYSIYMHLSRLDGSLPAVGSPILRNATLGLPGSFAGTRGVVHFEIVAAPDQIVKLCGREQRTLDTSTPGRTTVIGTVYAKLPAGTGWKSQVSFPIGNAAEGATQGVASEGSTYTSTEDLYVGLNYENAACVITIYDARGHSVGTLTDAQGHYNLHDVSSARFPERPLAGYELMRYGRTIGNQTLLPVNAAHWRQIPHPGGGRGWVDLNAENVRWFSDADFPHWRGWHLVSDDSDGDVRCTSAIVNELRRDGAATPPAPSLTAPAEGTNFDALKRLICLFPSEWVEDDSAIESRYGWVKTLPIASSSPTENFAAFKAFIKAQGFWTAAALDIPATHWHLNPKALIGLLRGPCLWPDLANRWQTGQANHALPNDVPLSAYAKACLYNYALRSSTAAARDHTGNKNTAALLSLDSGNALIFGMRIESDPNANNGRGLWDDRVVVLKFDQTGLIEVKHNGRINTEPSGWYLDGGQFKSSNNGSNFNVGGSTHKDSGRLAARRSYEYQPYSRPGFGPNIPGTTFNILRKTISSPVERLTTTLDTLPPNSYVSAANTHWITGTTVGFYEGQTMHFHRGYASMTGSAGCQTFPTAAGETFHDFANTLKPLNNNSRVQYVLEKMHP